MSTVAIVGALALLGACSSGGSAGGAGSSSPSAPSTLAADPAPLTVLVSNDDGVGAPGIDALVKALEALPAVTAVVYAPTANQSGSGASTTPGGAPASPATTASGHEATAVAGFPADAVIYGLGRLSPPPQLVVSGANLGQNLGPAIDLSGTIGAARAAAQRGIPALAVSAGLGTPVDYDAAVKLATDWVTAHRAALAPPTAVVNLNAPSCMPRLSLPVADVTPDTTSDLSAALQPSRCTGGPPPSTDVAAFEAGYPTRSLVPLQPGG